MSWCRAPLWGPMTRFYFFSFFCRKIALLFVLGRPLWREDGSVICSAICQLTESRRTRTRLYPSTQRHTRNRMQTPKIKIVHYCLIWDYWVPFPSPLTTRRDYGGSILTRLHTGKFTRATVSYVRKAVLHDVSFVTTHSLRHWLTAGIRTGLCRFWTCESTGTSMAISSQPSARYRRNDSKPDSL
jgi:hypothetical protein